jgi:hypothetical protein
MKSSMAKTNTYGLYETVLRLAKIGSNVNVRKISQESDSSLMASATSKNPWQKDNYQTIRKMCLP